MRRPSASGLGLQDERLSGVLGSGMFGAVMHIARSALVRSDGRMPRRGILLLLILIILIILIILRILRILIILIIIIIILIILIILIVNLIVII